MASRDPAPGEAPPSYLESQSTGQTTGSRPNQPSRLEVPQAVNGIPAAHRRSMEDEGRPVPEGWVRQFDPKEHHQFFVDTKANPPRSIWHHPYDDDEYLSTLSSEERERIQDEEAKQKRPITPAGGDEKTPKKDIHHETFPELPPRPDRAHSHSGTDPNKKKSLGERLKEKATGMTKEERDQEKRERAQQEREAYELHQKYRIAMARAAQTGQPQFLARDRDGKDVYVEPPNYYGGYGGYGRPTYGYSPYAAGPYSNARYIRPAAPYGRPYGGYGGAGLGLPILGGLAGGALLGGLLF